MIRWERARTLKYLLLPPTPPWPFLLPNTIARKSISFKNKFIFLLHRGRREGRGETNCREAFSSEIFVKTKCFANDPGINIWPLQISDDRMTTDKGQLASQLSRMNLSIGGRNSCGSIEKCQKFDFSQLKPCFESSGEKFISGFGFNYCLLRIRANNKQSNESWKFCAFWWSFDKSVTGVKVIEGTQANEGVINWRQRKSSLTTSLEFWLNLCPLRLRGTRIQFDSKFSRITSEIISGGTSTRHSNPSLNFFTKIRSIQFPTVTNHIKQLRCQSSIMFIDLDFPYRIADESSTHPLWRMNFNKYNKFKSHLDTNDTKAFPSLRVWMRIRERHGLWSFYEILENRRVEKSGETREHFIAISKRKILGFMNWKWISDWV